MARVDNTGWLCGQTMSTLQPAAAKAMASRAVENHRHVVASRTCVVMQVPYGSAY